MPLTRIYLPMAASDLSALARTGELAPGPHRGHAPTQCARSMPGRDDEEEREYAAWLAAATDAGELAGETRRVVASADVDSALVSRARVGDTEVTIEGAIALSRFVSFHTDEEPGGNVADLLWYDVSELSELSEVTDGL